MSDMIERELNENKAQMKAETRVFYYWLYGDIYWYLAEIASAEDIGKYIDDA